MIENDENPYIMTSSNTPFFERPQLSKSTPASDPIVERISTLVMENLLEDICIDDLPKMVYSSRAQIYRKIKSRTGQSPSRFICSIRLEIAFNLLHNNNRSISNIARSVGFNDPKYFFRVFRREYGMVPSAVRKMA